MSYWGMKLEKNVYLSLDQGNSSKAVAPPLTVKDENC